jgi:hypothetical protein
MSNYAVAPDVDRCFTLLLDPRLPRALNAGEPRAVGHLMTTEEAAAFVKTYLLYLGWSRLPPTSRAEGAAFIAEFTAHAARNPYTDEIDELFGLIHKDPELAWDLIREIISAAAGNDHELAMFGAGDLETFVHVQAVPFADRIEAQIRSNAAFRRAFESVYIGESTPAEVGRRFNTALRASGVPEESIIDWWSGE